MNDTVKTKQIIDEPALKKLIEAAIFIADTPVSVKSLKHSILADYKLSNQRIMSTILAIQADFTDRGIELVEIASGYRFQAVLSLSEPLSVLFKEKAPRYSRALLETMALIAYHQPITRGAIEDIRGVAVSSHITKTLLEREWIKIVGHKEVPGKPALYATTKEFLDYFSLKSLAQLPELMPIKELSLSTPDTNTTVSDG